MAQSTSTTSVPSMAAAKRRHLAVKFHEHLALLERHPSVDGFLALAEDAGVLQEGASPAEAEEWRAHRDMCLMCADSLL